MLGRGRRGTRSKGSGQAGDLKGDASDANRHRPWNDNRRSNHVLHPGGDRVNPAHRWHHRYRYGGPGGTSVAAVRWTFRRTAVCARDRRYRRSRRPGPGWGDRLCAGRGVCLARGPIKDLPPGPRLLRGDYWINVRRPGDECRRHQSHQGPDLLGGAQRTCRAAVNPADDPAGKRQAAPSPVP